MTMFWILFLPHVLITEGKEPELPLCPTNIQFFPQNLPMHCRMPTAADMQNIQQNPTMPPFPPPFYQSPPPGKEGEPIPIPMPPGMSPLPGGMPLPGPMPMPPFPGPIPMPGPIPIPMPGPPGPAHKLPVIVMPFYSPDNSFKKQPPRNVRPDKRKKYRIRRRRPRHRYYSDTDDSSDTDTSSNELTDSSESDGLWADRRGLTRRTNKRHREKRRRHERQELLTPVLQYVTKDGYVIFEKKISKGEAKDWLKVKTEEKVETSTFPKQEIDEFDDVEHLDLKPVKEEEKIEVKTERNIQKHHKRKKYRQLKKAED